MNCQVSSGVPWETTSVLFDSDYAALSKVLLAHMCYEPYSIDEVRVGIALCPLALGGLVGLVRRGL